MDPSENECTSDDPESGLDSSDDDPNDESPSMSSMPSRFTKAPKKKPRASKATRAEYEITKVYRLAVPLGKETVEAALKALNYLWEVQAQDTQNPNRFPKLRQSVLVSSTRDAYLRRLVHDTVTPWPDRGVYCAQRDGYSVEDLMRMMVTLWKGFDSWDMRQSLIRDRMSISLRHQAFFRDENLRMMSLSDCFRESLRTSFNGTTTKVHGLAFCLRAGKTQPDFKTDFAMVLRHKDYMRCGVSATAMYLFERFHVSDNHVEKREGCLKRNWEFEFNYVFNFCF